jgi:L,D-transpeptidase ErfK/SrfK
MRLHPDDVADLFPRVSTGMPGTILYQPVLLTATSDGAVYLEAHNDVYRRGSDLWLLAQTLADRSGIRDRIDWELARSVISERNGVPHDVSIDASSDR